MDDGVRVEPLASGDERTFVRAMARHFYEDTSDEALDPLLAWVGAEEHRRWVVRDRGRIVGNYGIDTTDVSLPGGGRLPTAAVTAVGVAQTHRRRGLLTAMMRTALDDAVERGEAVALLYASESAIYPRFGFGPMIQTRTYTIDRPVAFHDPLEARLVEHADVAEALDQWPAILERLRDQRSGAVGRPDREAWRLAVEHDPPAWRDGATELHRVHVPGRGYATYRVKGDWDHESDLPAGEVRVEELVGTDPEAEAALWQHVCDLDATVRTKAGFRPPDDAFPLTLVDPLRARVRVAEPLYARLLDVVRAFSSRSYATEGAVTFAVHDPSRDQSGTYHLDVSAEGAEVARVDADPELTLPIDVAASVWLGGVRAVRLADARRLEEHVAGAAARLDRLVAVDRMPWTPFGF